MNHTETFHRALKKYQLTTPVPADVQTHILRTRQATLKVLLNKAKKYSALVALSIVIYLAIRKLGIVISMFQAKVIAVATAVAVAASVSAGSFATAKQLYRIMQKSPMDSTAIDQDKTDISAGADAIDKGKKSTGQVQDELRIIAPSRTYSPARITPGEKRDLHKTGKSISDKAGIESDESKQIASDKEKADTAQKNKEKKIRERTGNIPTL